MSAWRWLAAYFREMSGAVVPASFFEDACLTFVELMIVHSFNARMYGVGGLLVLSMLSFEKCVE